MADVHMSLILHLERKKKQPKPHIPKRKLSPISFVKKQCYLGSNNFLLFNSLCHPLLKVLQPPRCLASYAI